MPDDASYRKGFMSDMTARSNRSNGRPKKDSTAKALRRSRRAVRPVRKHGRRSRVRFA